ncbi:MAG: hypothetical protein ACI84C_002406, partial [Flavobacteriales bacterium]
MKQKFVKRSLLVPYSYHCILLILTLVSLNQLTFGGEPNPSEIVSFDEWEDMEARSIAAVSTNKFTSIESMQIAEGAPSQTGVETIREKSSHVNSIRLPNSEHDAKLYSFSAEGLELKMALALFARANQLNIVPDNDVSGTVTLSLHNLPLERIMQALLEAYDFSWSDEDGLIRIRAAETQMFHVDYLRLDRK